MACYTIPLIVSSGYLNEIHSNNVAVDYHGNQAPSAKDRQDADGMGVLSRMKREGSSDRKSLVAMEAQSSRQQAGNNVLPSIDYDSGAEDNPHDYFYLHQPSVPCDPDTFLLILVCSAAQHVDLRQAIRETWGSVPSRHRLATRVVFMLGYPSTQYSSLDSLLDRESKRHGDVIQEDFLDTYRNLTLKTIGALKWATTFCSGARFVMKTDDDVFLNLPNLLQVLMDLSQADGPRFAVGHVIDGAKPITDRNSKWFTPTTLLRRQVYPRYLSGSAYLLSGNIVQDMYNAALSRKTFWLEDIFVTGTLVKEVQAALIHNDRFTITRPLPVSACFYATVISVHEMSSAELRDVWRELHKNDLDCTRYTANLIRKVMSGRTK